VVRKKKKNEHYQLSCKKPKKKGGGDRGEGPKGGKTVKRRGGGIKIRVLVGRGGVNATK